MPDTERTFTVAAPVEVVWDYLKDFGRAEAWDPGTKSCTREGSGPIAAGAHWHNVSVVAGRETTLDYRLERLVPNRLTFVGENKTATSIDDITLSPAADGAATQITYKSHIVFHGLAKLAGPFFARTFQQLGDQTQANLIRIINAL